MAGAGRTPQPRGQVKLLHRDGRARAGGGPTAGRGAARALPGSPAASFSPAPAPTAASRRRATARRPFSRASPAPLALRPWRCPVPATRYPAAGGAGASAYAPRTTPGCPRLGPSHPSQFRAPSPASGTTPGAPAPGSGALNPRRRPPRAGCSPSPGLRAREAPASAARLSSPSAGKGSGTGEGARRGWRGGCASRSFACGDPPGETWLRGGGGGRGAGLNLLRDADELVENLSRSAWGTGQWRFLGLACARAEGRAEFLIIKKLSYGRGDE